MPLKKIAGFIVLLLLQQYTKAQQLSQVTFSGATNFAYFSLQTNQNILLRISAEGKLLEWGTEEQSIRNPNYFAPKLLPYMGRVEYFGAEADSAFRNKPKSIGTCFITYYASYDKKELVGKIKTIGSINMDYYSPFEDKYKTGKLKMLGSNNIDWYSSFDDENSRGKLKTAGNTTITYYAVFDDKIIRGKIKNIGPFTYTWYTSYDRPEMKGALKSGNIRQVINNVTFIIW